MSQSSWNVIFWTLSAFFFVIGVLNLFLVHAVPGAFYLFLAFLYFPPANPFLVKTFRFSTPPVLKVIIALIIIWATLAVGELMELFESWLCNCESIE